MSDDLIGNKIANKSTKDCRTSPLNSSETVESETENIGFDGETSKERYIGISRKKTENYI